MKKYVIIFIVIIALFSTVFFTGCANRVLYGTWQLKETINAETFESTTPMFANIMVFTVNRNGTVTFIDKEFGTFTKSRNEFRFIETSDEEEYMDITGAWELNGGDLYIWPDDIPVFYHLVAIQKKAE